MSHVTKARWSRCQSTVALAPADRSRRLSCVDHIYMRDLRHTVSCAVPVLPSIYIPGIWQLFPRARRVAVSVNMTRTDTRAAPAARACCVQCAAHKSIALLEAACQTVQEQFVARSVTCHHSAAARGPTSKNCEKEDRSWRVLPKGLLLV